MLGEELPASFCSCLLPWEAELSLLPHPWHTLGSPELSATCHLPPGTPVPIRGSGQICTGWGVCSKEEASLGPTMGRDLSWPFRGPWRAIEG